MIATLPELQAAVDKLEQWPHLSSEAFHGLTGRIVEALDPYTEADPVAVLLHLLVGAGNVIGPGPHVRVGADTHPARLNAVIVGDTAKARKGTAAGEAWRILRQVDEQWAPRLRTGLSSGEGLIWHVRDALEAVQPLREKGRVIDHERVIVDEGERDKRLLVVEPEFAAVLKRMAADTNSLSAVIRQAWDSGDLATLTKNSPLRATGAHVSIVAHITREELLAHLTGLDRANGFANRFLFCLVRRSKVLPDAERPPEHQMGALIAELRAVVAFARGLGPVDRDEDARAIWAEVYPALSEGEAGMVGAIISRAEAQVLRLSALYAVLDRSSAVQPAHLRAALAVWDYAEASARTIFGRRVGLSVGDTILAALRDRGPLTATDLLSLFGRNRPSAEVQGVLRVLERQGKVRCTDRPALGGKGRPATVWEIRP